MGFIIQFNKPGEFEIIERADYALGLDELKQLIKMPEHEAPFIETVSLGKTKYGNVIAILDEEGRLKELPAYFVLAPSFDICGRFILCRAAGDGEIYPLNDLDRDEVLAMLEALKQLQPDFETYESVPASITVTSWD